VADEEGSSGAGGADPTEHSFLSHLLELRDRLLRAVLSIIVVLLALMPFANQVYEYLSKPLLDQIKTTGGQMLATSVVSPFMAPFKLVCFVSVMISAPYLFYQLWAFIAPGLYRHEKRLALPLLVSSTLLFYCGIAFARFVLFPLVFGFLAAIQLEGVSYAPDINEFLDFAILMFFAFGLAFEVPVATFLLVRTGITTRKSLAEKRPYIVVGAFVVAAVLTPPDPISQTLMAVPMWLLYESGMLFCRIFIPEETAESDNENNALTRR
jgi:sec-independent protein translocase protein TatC